MHLSSLAAENLKDYMLYAVDMSEWTTRRIGNLVLTLNGRQDSLFNYVFCQNWEPEESKRSAHDALKYLEENKIDTTWVVDSHMWEWRSLLEKLGLHDPTVTKKVCMKIPKRLHSCTNIPGLVLEEVVSHDALLQLDALAAKIFYCNANDLIILLRGTTGREQSRLRFFIAKLYSTVVGLCGMYVHGNVVGLYSDGVLPEYRNMGIASEMVSKRLMMASELFGCEYAVAQCMSRSVGLYGRLGFKVTGNLFLYPSLAVREEYLKE